jgi:poly(hydroxyalkanoate) depolymerase family esterase
MKQRLHFHWYWVFWALAGCAHPKAIDTQSSPNADIPFRLHVPAKPGESNALLVMLHGCDENATEFAEVTQMNRIADREGVFVLYPEQTRSRNPMGCWNWFPPAGGTTEESKLLALMQRVRDEHRITGPTFVAGLSAGGAMAGRLATCYPEAFQAAAIHSSVSYLRADDAATGWALMADGPTSHPAAPPPCAKFERAVLLVIQGSADRVVNAQNAQALMDDLSTRDSRSALVMLPELPHAWSGGAADHKYSVPNGVSASELIWSFFANQAER